MMDIITGKTRPDSGTVFFGSTIDLLRHNEPEIAQLGIGRKFQKPTVFEQLTVFENLELALKTHKGSSTACSSGSTARRATAWPRCCTPSTWRAACTAGRLLSHGQKQWLEIGMLLMQDPSCCCSTNRWPA
jgi:urea transport system ATP-binding protein